MPDAPAIQTPAPDAAPSAAPAAAPESAPQPYLTWQDRLERAFSSLPAEPPADASNGGTAAPPKPEADADDDDDDGSTPGDEGVKPAESKPGAGGSDTTPATPEPDAGEKPLSRRQQREHENLQKIAALEARLAEQEAAAEQIREQARIEAREQIEREQAEAAARAAAQAYDEDYLGNEERFQSALRLPYGDPRLSEPAPDGQGTLYDWLETRKERRLQHPHVEKHYQKVSEQRVEAIKSALERDHQAGVDAFWSAVRADLATAKELPGVDFDAVKAAPTFADRDRIVYAAAEARKDAEYRPQIEAKDAEIAKHTERIAQLEDEIRDLRLVGPRGLGSSRAPVTGGRPGDSTANPRRFDDRRSSRENLAAALGF